CGPRGQADRRGRGAAGGDGVRAQSTRAYRTTQADLRLAWLLTRGSDRREGWRGLLTAVGAALATGLGLVIAVLLSLDGHPSMAVGGGLLDDPGTRIGVIFALLVLFSPVLGFLGQCARLGAVH